jgi:hypothetical protein
VAGIALGEFAKAFGVGRRQADAETDGAGPERAVVQNGDDAPSPPQNESVRTCLVVISNVLQHRDRARIRGRIKRRAPARAAGSWVSNKTEWGSGPYGWPRGTQNPGLRGLDQSLLPGLGRAVADGPTCPVRKLS